MSTQRNIKLTRKGDVIIAECGESAPVEVKLIYARPVSDRSGQISVFDAKNKQEIYWLESVENLDPESRGIAIEALGERYAISLIQSVEHSFVNHGQRYLKVTTDRGKRYFNLKEPGKNVTWLSDDKLIIRDSMGNRYEVTSMEALDATSRANLNLVL